MVGELALGLALLELGLGQPRLECGDGMHFFLVLAVDLDEVGRHRVPPLFAVVHEADAGLESVELCQKIGQRGTPEMKKGVPVVEHPSVEDGLLSRSRIRSLKILSPLVWWVHSDSNRGLTGYEPVALDR